MASRFDPTHSGLLRRISQALLAGSAALMVIWSIGPWMVRASAAQPTVGLGTASSFAVLAGSTITNTGPTVISGDLGVSPGSAVTGFPPGLVTNGTQYVNDPVALQAQSDLTTAYNDAAGQSPTSTVTADLGGQSLVPGVYNSASSMGLTGTVTLDGQNNANAVFIFQVGSTLTTASNSMVNLINGAQACNVFWQVGSSATLGTDTTFVGSILTLTSASLLTGSSVDGRVLARNGQVNLESNRVTVPSCAATTSTTTTSIPTPTVTQLSPSWGASSGGMSVTVSGTGFSTTPGTTIFDFGPNQRTQGTCASTVSCTAVTPTEPVGWYAVTATVDGQTSSATGAPTFTFVTAGPAVITSPVATATDVSASSSAGLADTGANILNSVMCGLGLIALGGLLLSFSSRRKSAA